jgi:hypothetical protein
MWSLCIGTTLLARQGCHRASVRHLGPYRLRPEGHEAAAIAARHTPGPVRTVHTAARARGLVRGVPTSSKHPSVLDRLTFLPGWIVSGAIGSGYTVSHVPPSLATSQTPSTRPQAPPRRVGISHAGHLRSIHHHRRPVQPHLGAGLKRESSKGTVQHLRPLLCAARRVVPDTA